MKNISVEMLRRVYERLEIEYPFDDLLEAVKQESRAALRQEEEKEEEEAKAKIEDSKTIYIGHFRELTSEDTDSPEEYIDELVDEYEWWDTFYDSDGMDDDGATVSEYFLVGDRLFLVEVHCEANWVGDWSVRKNLPGSIRVESIEEINGFDILEKIVDGKHSSAKVRLN